MDRVDIDSVESYMGPAAVKRPLTGALDAEHLALNYYELEPGDSFAFGYHAHEKQEELFYIQSGTVTFETDSGEEVVEAGEVVRFSPGEFQRGTNEGDERVVALAMGAPQDSGETTVLRDCEDCGERTEASIEMAEDRDALVTLCVECGAETARFT